MRAVAILPQTLRVVMVCGMAELLDIGTSGPGHSLSNGEEEPDGDLAPGQQGRLGPGALALELCVDEVMFDLAYDPQFSPGEQCPSTCSASRCYSCSPVQRGCRMKTCS